MLLFKCSCGSFFTLQTPSAVSSTMRKCPNCGQAISWYYTMELRDLQPELQKTGMTMQIIPDDAKITVTFDP